MDEKISRSFKPKHLHKKSCAMCGKSFETHYHQKNVCSWECKREKVREAGRRIMRMRRKREREHSTLQSSPWKGRITKMKNERKRRNDSLPPCTICGYRETIDVHHEGRMTYALCPNHHALITRGIMTLNELMTHKSSQVIHRPSYIRVYYYLSC